MFGFSTTSFAGGDVRRLDLSVVPEPGTLALLALAAVPLVRRRVR